jgi:hypothetical protein
MSKYIVHISDHTFVGWDEYGNIIRKRYLCEGEPHHLDSSDEPKKWVTCPDCLRIYEEKYSRAWPRNLHTSS